MSKNDLQQFSRQLADWITTAIDRDRLPFRKVEINPPLLLPEETGCNGIVLWINRASAMAGGLILLPEKDEEAVVLQGAQTARALGLEHFAVWGRNELKLHNRRCAEEVVQIDWRPETAMDAGRLQRSLKELLEQLKLKAIAGPPTRDLDPLWLANLLHLSLMDVYEPTEDQLRVQGEWRQGDWARHALTEPALQKILLVICRMLALIMLRSIGRGIQPEKLEKALNKSCHLLPQSLRDVLVPLAAEPDLPTQAAVRLHHLFHRLGQLEQGLTPALVGQALSLFRPILRRHWPCLPRDEREPEGQQVAFNPVAVPGDSAPILYAEPALAAWLALQQSAPEAENGHGPIHLFGPRSEVQAADHMTASLGASVVADDKLRSDMLAALRLSWPGRRFRLPKSTPANWLQLLHLLGWLRPEGRISVTLRGDLPDRAVGDLFWPVLSQEFRLLQAELTPDGVRFDLIRTPMNNRCILGNRHGFTRDIDAERLAQAGWPFLAGLLLWPESLVDLLLARELVPAEACAPEKPLLREQQLFARSGFGQKLRGWSRHPAFGISEKGALAVWPPADKLERLANLSVEESPDRSECDKLDREIAFWFGPAWQTLSIPEPAGDEPGDSRPTVRPRSERIAERLLVDGLPVFPDHYLYDHYRPDLKSWTFSGPLQEQGRFFATIELADTDGNLISVDSEPVAGCLLLASQMTRETALPTDPDIAADILRRCLNDLNRLRAELIKLCLQEKSRNPERLALSLWRRWNLPSWDLLDRLASFL